MLTTLLLLVLSQEAAPLPVLEDPPAVEQPAAQEDDAGDDGEDAPAARPRRARYVKATFSWPAAFKGVATVAGVLTAGGAVLALAVLPLGFLCAAPGFGVAVVPLGVALAVGAVVGSAAAGILETIQGKVTGLLSLRVLVAPLVAGLGIVAGLVGTTAALVTAYWVLGETLKDRSVNRPRAVVLGGVGAAGIAGLGVLLTSLVAAVGGAGVYATLAAWDGVRP